MTSIADIKAMLDAITAPIYMGVVISAGVLHGSTGGQVEYQFFHGWDVTLAHACDNSWGAFNLQLLAHIKGLSLDPSALSAVLNSIQLDDNHWSWLNKSLAFKGEQYRWFFLVAEGYPQAACLIFHPKPSAFDGGGIFYIEYVAVAPWNRKNPMASRSFRGIGTLIVSLVSSYAVNALGLRPGYSLHALPKAIAFYETLGMQRFPYLDKDDLPYFELSFEKCNLIVAAK